MGRPRPLPHRPEAEDAILGGILLRGREALDEATELIDEEDFYQPRAQSVFRAMRALDRQGEPIDAITLEAQLRSTNELELVGGIEGIARLARYATAHNIRAHAKLVAEAGQVRRLVVASGEIAEEGREELEDADEFVARAGARVAAIVDGDRRRTLVPVGRYVGPVVEDIVARQRSDGELTGVPTAFSQLDDLTCGLQPTDLIILAARPSMGKTALALNIAANAAVTARKHWGLPPDRRPPRFPVLFFSLEMGAQQLTERILCAEARVDAHRVRRGTRLLEREFRALLDAGERVAVAPLELDDTAAPTITELHSRARRWRYRTLGPPTSAAQGQDEDDADPKPSAKKPLGLIVVDYLQLARGAKGRYDSREQEIAEISRGLKKMAKDLRVPVLAVAQLNRAVDARSDHRPQLSDLRESGAIEQDADVIMFVYREERYLPANAAEERVREVENKAEIIVGKQRNGPTGIVELSFMKQHARFENLSSPWS